jgi:hypothetical protein
MQSDTPRPILQIAKTAAQYGLVVGALLAIVSGGAEDLNPLVSGSA